MRLLCSVPLPSLDGPASFVINVNSFVSREIANDVSAVNEFRRQGK